MLHACKNLEIFYYTKDSWHFMFIVHSTARKRYKLSTLAETFVFISLGVGMGFFYLVFDCWFFEVFFLTEITYVQTKHMVDFYVKKDKCFPYFKVSSN